MRCFLVILLIICWNPMKTSGQDSTTVLSFNTFYSLVLKNHPIVKQATLLPEFARNEIRLARGSFDPKLAGSWSKKEYSDTEYYDLMNVSLKIPVWFPIDPVAGAERNEGAYLNPENYISADSDYTQMYWGFNLPVGKGLIIDERRATVKKALILQDLAEAQQIAEINKTLLAVTKDYWDWFAAYRNYELMERNIGIAEEIFSRTKLAYQYGEAAAVDTVQAKISLLSRYTGMQQARIELAKASLTLSNHLWNKEGAPLELTENSKPETSMPENLDTDLLRTLIDRAQNNHPELLKLRLKNETLGVDEQLAKENLKPRIDLSYYLLNQPVDPDGEWENPEFTENYKVGVNVEFPLFLRKERAKLTLTRLERSSVRLEEDFTEHVITNKINAQFVSLLTLQDLLIQQQEVVNNWQIILDSERLNLENGESDLFKINLQLEKLIESETKLIKSISTYQKDLAELFWAAGISSYTL